MANLEMDSRPGPAPLMPSSGGEAHTVAKTRQERVCARLKPDWAADSGKINF
jgi:hypothetical protein